MHNKYLFAFQVVISLIGVYLWVTISHREDPSDIVMSPIEVFPVKDLSPTPIKQVMNHRAQFLKTEPTTDESLEEYDLQYKTETQPKPEEPVMVSFASLNSVDQILANGIDTTLVQKGQPFMANFDSLLAAGIGQSVEIEVLGQKLKGSLQKKQKNKLGDNVLKVALDEGPGNYLHLYTGGSYSSGKLYTANGDYMFEYQGKQGFIISIFEYKKINNALYID